MINRIEIELPLPVKVGVFFFNRKKKVGFSFDNLAKFSFSEEHDLLNKPNALKNWVKDNGEKSYMAEALYHAHLSYNMHLRIKDFVTRDDFMTAINKFSKSDGGGKIMEDVVKVWSNSETFGYKDVPGKKKAEKH